MRLRKITTAIMLLMLTFISGTLAIPMSDAAGPEDMRMVGSPIIMDVDGREYIVITFDSEISGRFISTFTSTDGSLKLSVPQSFPEEAPSEYVLIPTDGKEIPAGEYIVLLTGDVTFVGTTMFDGHGIILNVFIDDPSKGTVDIFAGNVPIESGETVTPGTTVIITVTPTSDDQTVNVTLDGRPLSGTGTLYSFIMPPSSAWLSVEFGTPSEDGTEDDGSLLVPMIIMIVVIALIATGILIKRYR